MNASSSLGPALADQDTDERDQTSRGSMTLNRESGALEALAHGVGGEPKLAIYALAEPPAILLPDPDEVVHLHGPGLVLQKATHDQPVRRMNRNRAIEFSQLPAEVAEREHEPTTGSESHCYTLEDAGEIGFAFEMRERITHADDKLDLLRDEPSDVADVPSDRLDRQAVRPFPQLGQEPLTEVDSHHLKAEAREGNGLEAGSAAEIHGGRGAMRRADAETLQQSTLLSDLCFEVAEHARVVLRQEAFVVVAHRCHVVVSSARRRSAGPWHGAGTE